MKHVRKTMLATISFAILCLCIGAQAQSIPACAYVWIPYVGDAPVPGQQCTSNGNPWGTTCWVGTNKCTAICWDCLFNTPSGGGPINLANGNVFIDETDISVPGLGGGINLSRTWNSEWPFGEGAGPGMFGGNWRSSYEESIWLDSWGLVKYARGTGGIWTLGLAGESWPNFSYSMIAPANAGLTMSFDGNFWTLTFRNGDQRLFDGATGRLLSITDRNGNRTQLSYDSYRRLTAVTDPAGRHLYLSYAGPSYGWVTGVTSDFGVSLTYSYDSMGRLAQVTKPDQTTVSFQYDNNSMITAVLDSNGKVLEAHTYDGVRRGLTSSRAGGAEAITVTYPVLAIGAN